MGNSLGRAPVGRSDTGITTGWTEGKPWESSVAKERYGSDGRVDGRESVENSLGRAPVGRSGAEATRGSTGRKPWKLAWGELRWEGAIRKRREGGRGETVGNSLGRAPVGRSDVEATRWKGGNRGK